MIYFEPAFIHSLKEQVPLSAIVSQSVALENKSGRKVGLCPFHPEKTPSFMVDDNNGSFHCFGCGVHGDVIAFLTRLDGLDFPGAVKYLADYAGVKVPGENSKKEQQKHALIWQINDFVAKWCHEKLLSCDKALDYLINKRGVSKKMIEEFCLGYIPKNTRDLIETLQQHFSDELIIASGIANEHMQCRFWDRIMFPIINSAGVCVGFSGRILTDKKRAKYVNTIGGLVFKKTHVLYGIHLAKDAIKSSRVVYVVEGYLDVIAMRANGFENTVACMGLSISADALLNLWTIADTVILALDNDDAGRSSAHRIVREVVLPVLPIGKTVKIATLNTSKDPDTLLQQKDGQLLLTNILTNALPLDDFIYLVLYEMTIKDESNFQSFAELRNLFRKYSAMVDNRDLRDELHRELKNKLYNHRRFGRKKELPIVKEPNYRSIAIQALRMLLHKYPEILQNNSLGALNSHILDTLFFKSYMSDSDASISDVLTNELENIPPDEKFSYETAKRVFSFNGPRENAIDCFNLLATTLQIDECKMEIEYLTSITTFSEVEESYKQIQILTDEYRVLHQYARNLNKKLGMSF